MIPTAPSGRTHQRSVLVALCAALALLLVALVGTGCSMIVGFDAKVNQDGSGTVGIRVAADKELQSALGQQAGMGVATLFSGLKDQIGPGWTTRTGTDPDGTQWTVSERSFKDPAELQRITTETAVTGSPFSGVTLTRTENLFSVHMSFKGTMDSGKVTQSSDLKSQIAQIPSNILSGVVKVENRLTLPGTIKSNNATEVQGSTLIWRGDGSTPALQMSAESVSYKWGVVAAFIVVGALLVIALAVVLVVLAVMMRRRKGAAEPVPALAAAAVTPAPAPASEPVVVEPAAALAEPAPAVPVEAPAPATAELAPASEAVVPVVEPAPAAPPVPNAFLAPMPVEAIGDAEGAGGVEQAEGATSGTGDAAESPAPTKANPFLAAMPPTRPPDDDPRP